MLHMKAALAEFTRVGLMAAKRRGLKLGRKPSLTPARVTRARSLTESGESPRAVATTLRVGRTTLWRPLRAAA
jgi:DNA invertase Pin-like site-specific DNA recombinase